MDALTAVIVSSLLVSALSLSGGALLLWKKFLGPTVITNFVSFAAGILLGTAFLDLLTESAKEAKNPSDIFLPALSGIVLFFFLERFLLWFHHHDHPHNMKPSTFLILFGDGFHNIIDGVAIASAYLLNPSTGIATTLAIAMHEAPHELADFSILVNGGMKKSKALFYNFLSGCTALIGAIGGFFFLEKFEPLLPIIVAFTAGNFIYIACSDLIPELHKDFVNQKNWKQAIPFIVGLVVTWVIVTYLE